MDSAPEANRGNQPLVAQADVVVVGAGIVGLTCALLLAEVDREVVVIEASGIAAGVSGYTTAKLTAGHGLAYSHLESAFGPDAAEDYATAQVTALQFVRDLVSAVRSTASSSRKRTTSSVRAKRRRSCWNARRRRHAGPGCQPST